MATIIVCGGSIVGSAVALMLAANGHAVTVLERDPAPPPADPRKAWDEWTRKGVAQFQQPHNLFPRFRLVLEEELPGLMEQLVEAGCSWLDPTSVLPPSLEDRTRRPDDDRFRFVTGRRPVVECVLALAAQEAPGVTFRRGVSVESLLTGAPALDGVPHVRGVRTAGGEELAADLVIDASGRLSRLSDWLADAGARPPHTEAEDSGFVYHTRYFTGPRLPRFIGPVVSEIGTFSILTIPGDNDTWSVTVWAASSDKPLRALRDAERFTRVVEACPLQKHWLKGEPITDVLSMAGILDKYRRFVVDGTPVATGIAAVGDAWACTNPSAGRGMTVGIIHAQQLLRAVRHHLDDPVGFALAFHEATEEHVAPFYWNQITTDRARIAQMDALREGRPVPPPDPTRTAIFAAMSRDAEVFRAVLETVMCLALPQEAFNRPGLMDRVRAYDGPPSPSIPGPDRAELLALLA